MASNVQIKNISGRVGSYAISTVNLNSFTSDTLACAAPKGRKTRNAREIIHKIFAECATATEDPFWADKFNSASYGKFPPKFSYNDGILTYRKGAKNNSLELPMNKYEAAQLCMDFFRTNGGIFSELDQQHSLQLQYNRSQDVLSQGPLKWADLNKKMQTCLLSYYVTSMKSVMNLKDSEIEQLRQVLHLGIKNKLFGKHNIDLENNRIQTIQGLLWNNNDRYFFINPELKPVTTRSYSRKKEVAVSETLVYKDMTPQFAVKWNKYTEALNKKMDSRIRAQRRIRVIHQSANTPRRLLIVSTDTTTLSPRTPNSATDNTDATDVTDIEDSDE